MKLKINFKPQNRAYSANLNEAVNGFINHCLGENNDYHGKMSDYAVSSLQGGKLNKNGELNFENNAFLIISSPNCNFIGKIVTTLMSNGINSLMLIDMKVINFEINEFQIHSDYDIIKTISPIMLKNHKKIITCYDDEFINILNEKSINKLIALGVNEKKAKTIKIEPFHFEKAKTKMVLIKGKPNICSQVMLIIKGDKNARRVLYEIGLGKSTGFGFGSIEIQ